MSISIQSTLLVWKSSLFCATSCVTLREKWCFSGMAEQSIRAPFYETFFSNKKGFMSFVSRLMLQRSIPLSLSGPRPSVLCPTVRQTICKNSEYSCAAPSKGSKAPSGYCGLACKPPICLGLGEVYPLLIRKSIIRNRRDLGSCCFRSDCFVLTRRSALSNPNQSEYGAYSNSEVQVGRRHEFRRSEDEWKQRRIAGGTGGYVYTTRPGCPLKPWDRRFPTPPPY